MILIRNAAFFLLFLSVSVCIFQSCVPQNKFLGVFNRKSVKNPPKDTFVFANEIHITPGIISKDEENRLKSFLDNYWDDSVKAREVQQFGLFYRIKNAQRFDTFALGRSKFAMRSYLQSQGYFNASLNDTFRIDTFKLNRPKQQFRAIPIMLINPGKRLKIDSISYSFVDTARRLPYDSLMQQLALQKSSESLLKPGDPYSKQIIGSELDRLVSWYRQNGFYRLTREAIVAYVDTTDKLIDSLTIDPFELARKISQAAERRKQNPLADIEIMQATKVKDIPFDSLAMKRYYIGNVYYYPETADTAIADTLLKRNQFNVRSKNNVFMKYPSTDARFHFKVFNNHTYVSPGLVYDERLFYKTVNAYGQMGPWKQVEIRDSIRQDTVDFHIFLTPYKKMNYKFSVDLTRSTADFVSSNNLFGVGGNITFTHRNLFKDAVQFAATGRAGVELNLEPKQELLQTVQGGFGVTFGFQNRLLKKLYKQKQFDVARSLLSFNSSYTERKEFYRLRSLTASFGDEWAKDGWVKTLRPVNVELYSLDVLPQLDLAFKTNPFLKTAFNTGSVFSGIFTYTSSTWPWKSTRTRNHYFRFGAEYAGYPIDLFSPLTSVSESLQKNLYHYAKTEFELIEKFQKPASPNVLVLRGFAGIGVPISGQTLPFFKQFVAGGPNSMRAWGLRQLGLGRSKLSDTSSTFRDRFGDLQLEANVEYRFPLATVGSAKFSSAFFMDIGNIWNIRNDPSNPDGTFRLNTLPDFAVAAGVGLLRLNVANFIFRVDFALKVKDPAVRENNGWLFKNFTWKNENDRNNYAFQIGIGLPF